MRIYLAIVVLVLGLAIPASSAYSESMKMTPHQIIDSLGWLAGYWQGEDFEATYSTPKGGVILSMSKEVLKVGDCFHEFERFEAKDSNVIVTPYPNGNKSVSFTLIDYDPAVRKAVFENKTHDYPSQIVYESTRTDILKIYLSGTRNGQKYATKLELYRQR